MKAPTLHLIVDAQRPREHVLDMVRAAVDNGVDWIHLRDHQATARDLLELAEQLVTILGRFPARLAVNDRVDVALAVGAAGVQVGERGLPIEIVRRIAPGLQIGASVHDVASATRAAAAGADWLIFGHVFPTSSHPGEPPRGLAELRLVVDAVNCPVIAIGGIGSEQVEAVLIAGASGIAVISAILDAADPGSATRELRAQLME